ncbi:oxygenase [Sporosarcina sp. HYO08]|nr:oxygenase [Sporosarcina sp. HYO08]
MEQIAHYKEVMGNYPTGVTVVTALDENGEPMGMTVNSFASVSLDPLLVLWSIDKGAHLYEQFLKADQFAVNILADDQRELCSLFASRTPDRFGQCKWEKSELNLPVLEDSLAVLQCKTFKQVEAGDHVILIGEVVEIEKADKAPLLYHKRTMGAIPTSFYQA